MGYDTAWDPVLEDAAGSAGLDKDLLKAIARQENVSAGDLNPLGISTDAGPRHYESMDEAKAAIYHQARVMTDPSGLYRDFVRSGDIHDLVKVYSAPGESNDVYGTNRTEGSGIIHFLNQLKGGKTDYGLYSPIDNQYTRPDSLLERFRTEYPDYKLQSNDTILKAMRDEVAPGMDETQFSFAATSPGGFSDIQAYQNSTLAGLRKNAGPEADELNDTQLLQKTYDYGVDTGAIDKNKESFDDFKERYAPDNSWMAQTGRFTKWATQKMAMDVGNAFVTGTVDTAGTIYTGALQMGVDNQVNYLTRDLAPVYPGQDNSAKIDELMKLPQPDAEKRLREYFAQAPPDANPHDLSDKLEEGLWALKNVDDNKRKIAWAQNLIQGIDKAFPMKTLPQPAEKILKTIGQTPAQVLVSALPGLRETGNYAQLYKGNFDQISADHPDWTERQKSDRAHHAAMAQFPVQEILSLLMVGKIPGVSQALSKLALGIPAAGVAGGFTFSANKIIQNIADDKPPLTDVAGEIVPGAVAGALGRGLAVTAHALGEKLPGSAAGLGSNLSVASLHRALMASPQIRKAMGVSEAVVSQDAGGANAFVDGNPSNPVNQTLRLNALDMLIAGTRPVVHFLQDAAPDQPETSPLIEAFQKSEEARKNGDIESAIKYIDQAVALANSSQRDILNQHIADQLRAVNHILVKPSERKLQPTAQGGWTTLMPGQSEAEIPPGAETRTNTFTGLVEYQVKPGAQPNPVNEYFGLDNAPQIETESKRPSDEEIKAAAELTAKRAVQTYTIRGGPQDLSQTREARPLEKWKQTSQNWNVGDTVNVGALKGYKILNILPPEAGADTPDTYVLRDPKGRMYSYIQNRGLRKIEPDDPLSPGETIPEAEINTVGMPPETGVPDKPEEGGTTAPQSEFGLGALFGVQSVGPAMRAAKTWIAEHFPGWKASEDALRRALNPGQRGGIARDIEARAIRFNAKTLTDLIVRIRTFATQANLNSVFDHAAESNRREAWFNLKPDAQLRQWITDWSLYGTTGDPTADRLMQFNEAVRKYYNWVAQNSEVTNKWLTHQFSQAFKEPKQAERWFEAQISQNPSQIPTIEDALAQDPTLELKTYNPERLMLLHAGTIIRGTGEIDMLHQMVQDRNAELKKSVKTGEFRAKGVDQDVNRPDWTDEFRNAADGKTYAMSPEAAGVLRNQFNPDMLHNSLGAMPGHFFSLLKGVLGIKLAWSLYHPYHMIGIISGETMNEQIMREAKGLNQPGDLARALSDWWEGPMSAVAAFARQIPGVGKLTEPMLRRTLPSVRRMSDLLKVMQGIDDPSRLSTADLLNYQHLMDMGIVARPSFERLNQWSASMVKNATGIKRAAGEAGQMVYNFLTNAGFQHFYFGEVIPSIKMMAALRRRDTVFRYYDSQGINLRDPVNAAIWRAEAGKINRDIEGRFGEMLYSNLFWNQTAKALGKVMPLSLGWSLSQLRVHGDAIQDFTDNMMNLDRIKNHTYKNPEFVTNRMLFFVNYWANTIVTNITVGVALGGVSVAALSFRDLFWPKIGTKPNGEDERLRPPYWSTEVMNLAEGARKEGASAWLTPGGVLAEAGRFYTNKLTSGAMTLWQLFNNKDYRNRKISDETDPLPIWFWDKIKFFGLEMGLPIGVQSATQPHSDMDWKGHLAAWLGFGPAPGWVNREPWENTIVYKAQAEYPLGVIGHARGNELDARTDYMNALLSHDPTEIAQARAAYKAAGANPLKLRNAAEEVQKYGHGQRVDTALMSFKRIASDSDLQLELLETVPRARFLDYFRLASKATKTKWIEKYGPVQQAVQQ